tara:strand:+ start:618 stop:926 length:309 start_codon:yes stop_codon:yes gene_type:complete
VGGLLLALLRVFAPRLRVRGQRTALRHNDDNESALLLGSSAKAKNRAGTFPTRWGSLRQSALLLVLLLVLLVLGSPAKAKNRAGTFPKSEGVGLCQPSLLFV